MPGSPPPINVVMLRGLIDLDEMKDFPDVFDEQMSPLRRELTRIGTICKEAKGQGGLHPNVGHAQHLCAELAFKMMGGLSKAKIAGTKANIEGTSTGKLRTIASRLYEICTGQVTDMKRAVSAVLQRHRRLGTLQPRKPYRRSTRDEMIRRMLQTAV
jgi:hypothetical protein